ncbi:MAG: cytosine deaminase, partial [Bacilli bacterium]
MLIKNALLKNDDDILYDIIIEEGLFKQITPTTNSNYDESNEQVIDAKGLLVIPPFIEPHIHLDTTMSAGQPRFNESGTLFEGIAIWSQRKQDCSIEDVKERALQAIKLQIGNGIQYIRTHVDITDPELIALKAMLQLKEELKDKITLQIVAFPQEGILSYHNGKQLIEQALQLGADVIGAIPHFEFTREYGIESINYIVELALKYNVLIDVHCDEIDDEQSRFIEVLATRALESGLKNKVSASHTTAMGSYNDAYAYKLFRLLRLSQINFIANPLVNIHLQGRFDTYPKRRGMTRVKELHNDNINVCFGHDDIKDPWYPLGTGNMLEVCSMGLHVSQMMGYSQINNALDFITYNSAKTLNLSNYGIV